MTDMMTRNTTLTIAFSILVLTSIHAQKQKKAEKTWAQSQLYPTTPMKVSSMALFSTSLITAMAVATRPMIIPPTLKLLHTPKEANCSVFSTIQNNGSQAFEVFLI